MLDPEVQRYIKNEVARQVNVILSGTTQGNTTTTEDIGDMFPGSPTLPARPIMHPWGFVSRAVKGVRSIIGRQGDHPGAKLVLGHRDPTPPSVEEGESAVYSMAGYVVKVGLTSVTISKDDEEHTAVLGEPLVAILSSVLGTLSTHTHAAPGAPPTEAALFIAAKAQVDANEFLAKDGGGF